MILAGMVNALVAGWFLAWLARLRGFVALLPAGALWVLALLFPALSPAAVTALVAGTESFSIVAGGLALIALAGRTSGSERLHRTELVAVALTILVAGGLVYGSHVGWLPLEGLYGAGFGDFRLSTVLLLLALMAWVVRAWWSCVLLAGAQCVFGLQWLPATNLWDYLLDPFLVSWALVFLVATAFRMMVQRQG